jgi:hypothetical protein
LGIASRTSIIVASGAALAVAGGITAISFAASGNGHQQARTSATISAHAAAQTLPLRVTSVSPADGSQHVNGTDPVTITFNQPLPANTSLPRLSPAVPGTWRRSGDTVTFTPAEGFTGSTKVQVTVPGAVPSEGRQSPSAGGRPEYSASFTTSGYSTLRLQQLLAQLGYLPMTWHGVLGGTVTPGSMAAQLAAAYSPPTGSFSWQGGYPGQLHGLWETGSPNALDTGAITGFEADHGLPTDGAPGSKVWTALLRAAAAGDANTHGYSYAIASEALPETLTIWHDGHQVFSSPANTGIGDAPTTAGTFPVYEKLPFQVMQGTNPDGSAYADPVKWVSYFDGGQAVHYFPRGSYGWPQSLGCVELPYSTAEQAYGYLPYGTLVTVAPLPSCVLPIS